MGPFPARVAEGAAVGQTDGRVADATAFPAFLDDLGISPVAAGADPALGSPGHDLHVGGAAAAAGPVLPRAGIAAAADPPFLAQLPQISGDLSAVRAAGPDDRLPGLVQNAGQPQQHRRAEGAARGEGVGMLGHVRGQLFEEPGRALYRDRHRGFQRDCGLLGPDRGQRSRYLGDRGVRRGFQARLPAGKPGGHHGAVTGPRAGGWRSGAPPGRGRPPRRRPCGPRR
jgi:hypothetical protein